MVFPGLKSDQEIDDILAFLKQFDADGKKKLQDRRSIAVVAAQACDAGSIDNSREQDDNMRQWAEGLKLPQPG